MARTANPALIGAFVLGAIVLAVAGLVVFGGGKFFRQEIPVVLYFDEDIKGLAIGAPLSFKGIKIGAVTDIRIIIDPATGSIQIPVFAEIEPDRLTLPADTRYTMTPDRRGLRRLVQDKGMRAQIETQSFVTGQLAINLDFHPGTPIRLAGHTRDRFEIPTVPSTSAKIAQTLEKIPVAEIAESVRTTLKSVEALASAPEIREALVAAVRATRDVERLVADADRRLLRPAGAAIEKAAVDVAETLREARAVLRTADTLAKKLDAQTVPAVNEAVREAGKLARDVGSQTVPALNEALRETQKVARDVGSQTVPATNEAIADVRRLARSLERTSDDTRRLIAGVGDTVPDVSVIGDRLTRTLEELTRAARALRDLADYLERYPESPLRGKTAGGGQ